MQDVTELQHAGKYRVNLFPTWLKIATDSKNGQDKDKDKDKDKDIFSLFREREKKETALPQYILRILLEETAGM